MAPRKKTKGTAKQKAPGKTTRPRKDVEEVDDSALDGIRGGITTSRLGVRLPRMISAW